MISHAKDRIRRGRIYARAGIPGYWLVDVPGRVVEVRNQPGDDGSGACEIYATVSASGCLCRPTNNAAGGSPSPLDMVEADEPVAVVDDDPDGVEADGVRSRAVGALAVQPGGGEPAQP